jgi:tellurite resistance protein TerC
VIAVILAFFKVPGAFQHRLLFWGILGALVMRGTMIGLGATLIARFHWILYLFGAFLIITAVRMLFLDTEEAKPTTNPIVRLAQRWMPVCEEYHGSHFVVRRSQAECAAVGSNVGWMLTPMALALIMVETTDLIFAVDSIPRSSPSPATRSSSSPPTSSRSSACAASTSRWPA